MHKHWSRRGGIARLLWPLSLAYKLLITVRQWLYRNKYLTSAHPGRPVIVVGNVVAGGAGKTPVVIQLVQLLQSKGFQPGVISRGYGRRIHDCREVNPNSNPLDVGDEPALIARHCQVPIFVAKQRITAALSMLKAYPQTDVLICDDGLQHYALERDIELCVFHRGGLGNGWLLPAGPLRENWPRAVDAVLYAGDTAPHWQPPRNDHPSTAPRFFPVKRTLTPYAVNGYGQRIELQQLGTQKLHAVAAIARPDDFFSMLEAQGLYLEHKTALPDHYDFNSWNANKNKRETLICTEKDAVKLWASYPEAWAVGLNTELPAAFYDWLLLRLGTAQEPFTQGAAP